MSSTNDGDYKGPCSGEMSLRHNQLLDTHSDGGVALLNTRCVWFGSYPQTVILFCFNFFSESHVVLMYWPMA